MTRNLYAGASYRLVLRASPADLPARAAEQGRGGGHSGGLLTLTPQDRLAAASLGPTAQPVDDWGHALRRSSAKSGAA